MWNTSFSEILKIKKNIIDCLDPEIIKVYRNVHVNGKYGIIQPLLHVANENELNASVIQ
jgi:hypothetical protein